MRIHTSRFADTVANILDEWTKVSGGSGFQGFTGREVYEILAELRIALEGALSDNKNQPDSSDNYGDFVHPIEGDPERPYTIIDGKGHREVVGGPRTPPPAPTTPSASHNTAVSCPATADELPGLRRALKLTVERMGLEAATRFPNRLMEGVAFVDGVSWAQKVFVKTVLDEIEPT